MASDRDGAWDREGPPLRRSEPRRGEGNDLRATPFTEEVFEDERNRMSRGRPIGLNVGVVLGAVILGGVWEGYARHESFDHCLQTTLDRLHEAGIATIIVLDVAYQSCDVPLALARSEWVGRTTGSLGLPADSWRAQREHVNATIRRLAKGKAFILDPAPAFVSEDGFWHATIDGKAVYFDEHHLSAFGSMRLRSMFEQILSEITSADDGK